MCVLTCTSVHNSNFHKRHIWKCLGDFVCIASSIQVSHFGCKECCERESLSAWERSTNCLAGQGAEKLSNRWHCKPSALSVRKRCALWVCICACHKIAWLLFLIYVIAEGIHPVHVVYSDKISIESLETLILFIWGFLSLTWSRLTKFIPEQSKQEWGYTHYAALTLFCSRTRSLCLLLGNGANWLTLPPFQCLFFLSFSLTVTVMPFYIYFFLKRVRGERYCGV